MKPQEGSEVLSEGLQNPQAPLSRFLIPTRRSAPGPASCADPAWCRARAGRTRRRAEDPERLQEVEAVSPDRVGPAGLSPDQCLGVS